MKPEPEEKVMPSMAFFMEKKKSGKMQQALSRLMANLLLLLHILFVVGAAAAIAQPYILGETQAEKTVVVMDVSASMSDDLTDAKKFVESSLGKENTLILVGETADIKLEDASESQVKTVLSSLETRDVETDIVAGLEVARSYEGNIVVASDLVQTADTGSAKPLAESINTDRSIKFFDASHENKHGIVDVGAGENPYVEVKNFEDQNTTVELETPQGTQTLEISRGETERARLNLTTGRNTVSLPEDSFKPDNNAYLVKPRNETVEVTFIADSVNPYFREAAKAIEFTEFRSVSPPVKQELDADVYVVGETNRLLKSTASDLQAKADSGDSLILFAQPGLKKKGFSMTPLTLGERRNATVEITRPTRLNVGSSEIFEGTEFKGVSWANPREAIINRNYGNGNILLYNIEDEAFRYDFYYPVFWKETFQELEDRRSAAELNMDTGSEVERVEIMSSGFHNVSGSTFAANLESTEESSSEPVEINGSSTTDNKGEKDIQNIASVLLAVIAGLELIYLRWIGEL